MGRSCASLYTEEVMSAEIKPYIDPAELTDATTPWYGDMPDVAMSLPWSTNPESLDLENNPVWGWRIFLGAEDDPNRAKVEEWKLVDELAGLTKLWAGVYNGTIYLQAGDEAPEAATESDDMTGTPVASESRMPEQWRNGEPVLPFTPLAMDSRDEMLKNNNGQWRRLVWEPIGLFDVAPSKNVQGYNFERYTLWMVVEHPWVAFYTTKAPLTGPTQQNGAPARWPFSYYKRLEFDGAPETYQERVDWPGGRDGGFIVGFFNDIDHYSNGYRLAPLPWQQANGGELEPEDVFTPFDGVQQGQFYTLPPGWPCGRYLATAFDYRVWNALVDLYQSDGKGGYHYHYEFITKEQARKAILETIRDAATHSYSIDPALMEELGRSWPDGALEGTLWQTDPPEFQTVFSLHLDETTERWPHWLALMACHAPTALLTASSCAWYNDFRPAGGWPSGSYDPSNPPPSEDEDDPDDKPPSGTESDGGYIPDRPDDNDEDDKETDADKDGVQELPVGYYYEAGNGVQIKREWNALTNQANHLDRPPGWIHTIHIDDIAASGSVIYEIALTVRTANDTKTYQYGEQPRNMYYGVSASASEITVTWKSSYQGSDNLAKETTARQKTQSNFTASVTFADTIATSETPPDFCGTFLIATKTRSFTKRGTYKAWDKFRQRWKLQRYSRRFDVYRLSVRGDVAKFVEACAAANAPARNGSCSPASIKGISPGLDGPTVTAAGVNAVAEKSSTTQLIGQFSASIIAEYEPCSVSVSLKAASGNSWNTDSGRDTGSISGSFTASLPQTSATFEI
jgi:hypothetical protein